VLYELALSTITNGVFCDYFVAGVKTGRLPLSRVLEGFENVQASLPSKQNSIQRMQ
jgi:hypothetical protein